MGRSAGVGTVQYRHGRTDQGPLVGPASWASHSPRSPQPLLSRSHSRQARSRPRGCPHRALEGPRLLSASAERGQASPPSPLQRRKTRCGRGREHGTARSGPLSHLFETARKVRAGCEDLSNPLRSVRKPKVAPGKGSASVPGGGSRDPRQTASGSFLVGGPRCGVRHEQKRR